jgi:hypothetical protein
MEVRVIVWRAETNILKDTAEKCNDLFVTCNLGGSVQKSTDTHYRARNGGSFNWRMKFPVTYDPMKSFDDFEKDFSLEVPNIF